MSSVFILFKQIKFIPNPPKKKKKKKKPPKTPKNNPDDYGIAEICQYSSGGVARFPNFDN